MQNYLFLGDSITDADHLFTPDNLGNGYVSILSRKLAHKNCTFCNRGHDGFTIAQLLHMLTRDGVENNWDIITLLVGVNDVPVEVYTDHTRIPDEFHFYYDKILEYLTQHTTARLILIEPFLFDTPEEYKSWHTYIEAESSIIKKLAAKYHADFIAADQPLRMAAAMQGADTITLDGIHLTPVGNEILAGLWMEAYQE